MKRREFRVEEHFNSAPGDREASRGEAVERYIRVVLQVQGERRDSDDEGE